MEKFRGFADINFELGTQITLIAGQNGTQKSTLLGMLSQPFTITDRENPIAKEKPLCGGSYKSSFQEKFRLSKTFDVAKTHEWTLNLYENDEEFTIESIYRDREKGTLRFWKKGKRDAGSGYIQLPVIFLSLNRLMPLGEDSKLINSDKIELTQEEKIFTHFGITKY